MDEIADEITKADHLTALTGAGISTGAGIPDFRGDKGIYRTGKYEPDKILDINYFVKDPAPFYDFATDFLAMLKSAKPTYAHLFLADLERRGKIDAVITQNIDGLHQRAGSKRVIELHGSFEKGYCMKCGKEIKELEKKIPEACECGGIIKPDIVFFGEPVKGFYEAKKAVEEADLLLVLGSSLAVAPASILPFYCSGKIIIINKGPVFSAPERAMIINGDIDSFLRSLHL